MGWERMCEWRNTRTQDCIVSLKRRKMIRLKLDSTVSCEMKLCLRCRRCVDVDINTLQWAGPRGSLQCVSVTPLPEKNGSDVTAVAARRHNVLNWTVHWKYCIFAAGLKIKSTYLWKETQENTNKNITKKIQKTHKNTLTNKLSHRQWCRSDISNGSVFYDFRSGFINMLQRELRQFCTLC